MTGPTLALLRLCLRLLPRELSDEFGRQIELDARRRLAGADRLPRRLRIGVHLLVDVLAVAIEEAGLRLHSRIDRGARIAAAEARWVRGTLRRSRIPVGVSVLLLSLALSGTGVAVALGLAAYRGGLPGSEGARTVRVGPGVVGSAALLTDLASVVSELDAVEGARPVLGVFDPPGEVRDRTGMVGAVVTPGYLELLGGRWIVPRPESLAGDSDVLVLSRRLWEQGLGADPDVLGREASFWLDEGPRTAPIAGVLDDVNGYAGSVGVWIVRAPTATDRYPEVLGRLSEGATPAAATASLLRVGASLYEAHPREVPLDASALTASPAWRPVDPRLRNGLTTIGWLAGTLLLLSTVGVRTTLVPLLERRRAAGETARALGAPDGGDGWWSLALAGGLAATTALPLVAVTLGLERWLRAAGDPSVTLTLQALPVPPLAVAGLLLLAILPVVARRPRTRRRQARRTAREIATVAALATAAVALAIGIGTTRDSLRTRPTGISGAELAGLRLRLDDPTEDLGAAVAGLRSAPGVTSVGFVQSLPFSGEVWTAPFERRSPTRDAAPVVARLRIGSENLPELLGLGLLAGRLPAEGESREIVVSRDLAARLGGTRAALDQRLAFPGMQDTFRVVGVVSEVGGAYADAPSPGDAYLTRASWPTPWSWILVRGGPEARGALVDFAEGAARDRGVTLEGVVPFGQVVDRALATWEALFRLGGALAAAALVSGLIAILGLTVSTLRGARAEFRIRRALGAGLVRGLATGVVSVLHGLSVGTLAAVLGLHLLEGFGISTGIAGSLADARVLSGAVVVGFLVPALAAPLALLRRGRRESAATLLPTGDT